MREWPDIYDLAIQQNLKFYNDIDDCIGQCAEVFSGGPEWFAGLSIFKLLEWTDRAIKMRRTDE